ncbi:MAG TPA: hypothetical protein VGM94_19445, partial [Galbitalea sp.]
MHGKILSDLGVETMVRDNRRTRKVAEQWRIRDDCGEIRHQPTDRKSDSTPLAVPNHGHSPTVDQVER